MASLTITRKDIEGAFKLFYNRLPTPADQISHLENCQPVELLAWMMSSPEFLQRTGSDALILNLTKKLQDYQNTQVAQATSAAPAN